MKQVVLGILLMVCAASCSGMSPLVGAQNDAIIAEVTPTQRLLRALPPPAVPVVLSVYSFDDQTGQMKSAELPQYSRAVTQGGLALLKGALVEAGEHKWFRVLERGGVDHVLKEREIIRAMRAQYKSGNGAELAPLSPLLYAGVLLEGGVVSYESNTLTGGLGARYLGVGGSTTYRQDVVTVALRAVSVSTGEVLLSTLASKTILSAGIQGGAFRYLSYDGLLEAESGLTKNEPPQLAVRQAIELSVYSLILEGASKGLWKFKSPAAGKKVIAAYRDRFKASAPSAEALEGAIEAPAAMEPDDSKTGRTPSSAPQDAASQSSKEKAHVDTASSSEPEASNEEVPSGYYFQLAAYPASAEVSPHLLGNLKQSGLPVQIQRAMVGGNEYCRILVGPYRHLNQALQQQTHISEAAQACAGECGKPFLRKVGEGESRRGPA